MAYKHILIAVDLSPESNPRKVKLPVPKPFAQPSLPDFHRKFPPIFPLSIDKSDKYAIISIGKTT